MKNLQLLSVLLVLLRNCRCQFSYNKLTDFSNADEIGGTETEITTQLLCTAVCTAMPAEVQNPCDCNSFYICSNLGLVPEDANYIQCPSGLYFDVDTESCKPGSCDNSCPYCGQTDTSVAEITTESTITTGTETTIKFLCTAFCPDLGTEVQNPCDCTSFYICSVVGPVPEDEISIQCPPGLYFDGDVEGCIVGSCKNTCPYCGQTTTEPMYTTEIETTTKIICTAICTDIGAEVQNPCDCTSFYLCSVVGSVPDDEISIQCPPGLYFDVDVEGCIVGSCKNTCPYCGQTDTTLLETTTELMYTTEIETTTGIICTAFCTVLGAEVQNPCDCTSFYICSVLGPVPEDATSIQCPPGLYFDVDVEGCIVGSCKNSCPYCGQTDTTAAELRCTVYCTNIGDQMQNPCDCTSFYVCQDIGRLPDDAISIQCPPGKYFDKNSEVCIEGRCHRACFYCGERDTTTARIDSTTTLSPCIAYCSKEGLQIQLPCDCTSFYICYKEGLVPDNETSYQCPSGKYFDEETGQCIDGSCNNACPDCGETVIYVNLK